MDNNFGTEILVHNKLLMILYDQFTSDTTILEKCITLGPWGTPEGRAWVYMPEGFIKKIRISYGSFINGIEFHSVCSQGATRKSLFGEKDGNRTDMICIDYPDEYLTSISGTIRETFKHAIVTSLCFHTNQNSYGPYGDPHTGIDTPFSFGGKGGVIVGFHGGRYIHFKRMHNTLGPWGLSLGKEWTYIPEGFIKKIRISHGTVVNSIEFHTECSDGATKKSLFGGEGGKRTDTIIIDYPDEYLTSISGAINGSSKYVTSLYFHSNQNRYGPYGSGVGNGGHFSYDGKDGVIVGFHGSFDNHICSFGFYVMPKSLAMGRNFTFEEKSRSKVHYFILWTFRHLMDEVEIPRDVGPWGASGGKAWDDGVFNNIKQVRVQIVDPSNVIFGIQFKYVKKDGKCILSRLHGGIDGDVSEVEINLDGIEEYLTWISGFYGPVEGFDELKGITSITFHTNKKKHRPYGQESGEWCVYFTSTPSSGKVVGFHGRNDDSLTAIGVHMEYLLS
ncbi:hypothetical protein LXL04_031596 [Taraxacum kok-saghyz]